MTALSLDDLAALERLAKDLTERKWPSMPVRTPTVIALISQLRAAMEVISIVRLDIAEGFYEEGLSIAAALKAYDKVITGATAP